MQSTRAWSGIFVAATCLFVTTVAQAQSSILQVPSGEITKPKDLYFQTQATFAEKLDLSAQSMVGVGHDVDIGLSVYNFDFVRHRGVVSFDPNHDDREEPYGPLVLGVVQKLFRFGKNGTGLLFGTQTGVVAAAPKDVRVATRSYAMFVLELAEETRCAAGGYVANGIFVGGEVTGAPWGGCDIELVHEVLGFDVDWDAGWHANAGLMAAPKLYLTKSFDLAVGARAPNPWVAPEDRRWAAVMQFEAKELFGN